MRRVTGGRRNCIMKNFITCKIRKIKSRMRWTGHIAQMWRRVMHGNQKEKGYYEAQYIGGWIILKWTL
jgi:hypothetical protein